MTKLNQIVALTPGKKSRFQKFITEMHHGWGASTAKSGIFSNVKADSPLSGISRTYQPIDEDGEVLPPESRRVQKTVAESLVEFIKEASDFYDVVFCQETSNTSARADVVVGGEIILAATPVSFLLFLEKQLTDLRTFVTNIPTLPTDRQWTWDNNRGCYVSESETTHKTQKIATPIVKYEATKEHPAQVDMINKDITVGHWTTIHFSGAMPVPEKKNILERINTLQDAVKAAREDANNKDVEISKECKAVLDYIFRS